MNRQDEIISFLLGELSPDLREELGEQPETQKAEQDFSAIALVAQPVRPSSELRSRLMASIEQDPYGPFVARLATLLDVGRRHAQELLNYLDRAWGPTSWTGVHLIHLDGGPATAGLDVGFVKVDAGQQFPFHSHLGPERVLILQGGYQDSDGRIYRKGAYVEQLEPHSFMALPEEPLIFAVVTAGIKTV